MLTPTLYPTAGDNTKLLFGVILISLLAPIPKVPYELPILAASVSKYNGACFTPTFPDVVKLLTLKVVAVVVLTKL